MMNNLLRYSYLAFATSWIFVILFGLIVNPKIGIQSINDVENGRLILQLVANKPAILIFPGLDFLLGLSLIITSVSLSHKFERNILSDLQKIFGVAAGILFIYGAYSRISAFTSLSGYVNENSELKYFVYDVVNFLQHGNSFAVQSFLSLWLITVHFLWFKALHRHKLISYIGILGGVLGLFAFVIKPLAAIIILTSAITSIYWFVQLRRL